MSLEEIRKQIDEIDDHLLELINKRMGLVKEVGLLKKKKQGIIYRPEREKAILDRLKKLNSGPLNAGAIDALFLEIFAISRNFELPEKVAFLGPEGSFTHQAAEHRFGAMTEYLALNSIEAVFSAVSTSRTRFGVVPIENNQEGPVYETIRLLSHEEVRIVAEVPLPIHFCFATQEEEIDKIKTIYSKDIAFKQCRKFLRQTFYKNMPETVPVNSTSGAAHKAKEEAGTAAICSHIAARQERLPILFDNIEDSANNFTRFLIIAKQFSNEQSANDKTTIMVRLQDNPGALAELLNSFQKQKINLTKIESLPAKAGKKFKYWFFIDFDGHYAEDRVKKVLDNSSSDIKLLGSYVKLC